MLCNRVGHRLHLVVHRIVFNRGGTAHHISLDITAGGERRQQGLVDFFHGRFEFMFDHPMELKPLSRRHPQGSITVLVADIQVIQKLSSGDLAPRNAGAHHEDVLLSPGGPVGILCFARVTVILLVDPVILDEMLGIFAKFMIMQKFFGKRPAKLVAGFLDHFHMAAFQFIRHRSLLPRFSVWNEGRCVKRQGLLHESVDGLMEYNQQQST